MFKKEVKRLVLIVFLEVTNDSKWRYSYFAQPKPFKKKVNFLSYFSSINKQLKQKSYHMPKINEMLLKSECFQYAASLGLNMG